jgi:heat-inducible transcriptional repressor
MLEQPTLARRKADILQSIVQAYIETGKPVASRSLSRRRAYPLSPATIRNVMADLAEEGYLSQPHTSAGRVPTEKAFRFYVHSLTAEHPPRVQLARMQALLSEESTVEGRVERSSHFLSEITNHVGIAASVPTDSQTLQQIELLPLADRRVLVVVVTGDRLVHNRVVTLDQALPPGDLSSIRNYINRNFSGWMLSEVRAELARRLEAERAMYDALLRHLTVLNQKGLFDIAPEPEIYMDGAFNLVGIDLHLTREKLRELFRALQEKKRILELLDSLLEGSSGEIALRVGLGDAHPSMKELSLVGLWVRLPGGLATRVAVLGPMRMNYGRAMTAVQLVGRAFERMPV